MNRQTENPPSLFNSTQFGFSQIVIAPPGRHVFISGQTAWDHEMNIVGANNLALQTRKALDNLNTAVQAAGGDLENITMLRIYIVNFQQENAPVISEALTDLFGSENPPASTWVSVAGLADSRFMIEIEGQAVI